MAQRGRVTAPQTMSTKAALEKAVELQQAGHLDQAEEIYRSVLKQNPKNPDAKHLLGLIAGDRRDPKTGMRLILEALKLRPKSAVFHHNLAGMLGQLGQLDRAESHYRKAIKLQPNYAEAYHNLSGAIKFQPGEPLIDAAEAQLAQGGWAQRDLCFLHFALGKMLDDIGAYDRAAAHYIEGNGARDADFVPQDQLQILEAQMQTFTATVISDRGSAGEASDLPIFVVGMPRSGTSLVEQILASHPQVHGAGELLDIPSIAAAIPEHLPDGAAYPAGIPDAPDAVLKGFGQSYLKQLRARAPEAKRIVDKLPTNFWHLGLISLMLPQARIVHCRRDPLDTCLSCYFQNFTRGQAFSFDLAHLGLYYNWYQTMMAHWSRVLPGRIFEIDYEALVARPDEVAPALIDHCGLEWDDACIQFHKTKRTVSTASRWQVRQPLYQSSVNRAERYKKHLAPLIEILDADQREAESD